MKKDISVKTVVAIGIGTAVFFVLKAFVNIPTPIPNTTIQFSYSFLALMAALFGPVAGFAIGFIGHALGDVVQWGSIWWTWVIGSGLMGIVFAIAAKGTTIEEGEFPTSQIVRFNVIQFIGNLIVWAVIAPIGDIVIYAEPANKVFTQGIVAGLTNAIVVLVVGTLLLKTYAATRTKKGSLSKEN